MKPFSEACERNKVPILDVITPLLKSCSELLEIGSGSGQHAVYFAEKLPHLIWQTSDRSDNHWAINLWIDEANSKNIKRPFELDVTQNHWPESKFDAVFTANTAHIMPWEAVVAMIKGVGNLLGKNGLFIIYGPFNYQGQFTSESNARFEMWLKEQAQHQGIRDFEAFEEQANEVGLELVNDIEMPANNRVLVFSKLCDGSKKP
ncbi:DUF938 domain-containing protein [Aliikangiella marina]|nr:DUF938 domain-containing protein [Aliikangiella marina]